jgi:hypothetical protein
MEEIYTITNVYLNPGQVPLYQVDNSMKAAYTKNKLQVIEEPSQKVEESTPSEVKKDEDKKEVICQ